MVSALINIELPTTMLMNDEFDVSTFLSCPKVPLVNYVGVLLKHCIFSNVVSALWFLFLFRFVRRLFLTESIRNM